MDFDPSDKIALFIDGANTHGAMRGLGFDLDWRRLLDHFGRQARLVRACYYTAVVDDVQHDPLRPLLDFLAYNGFILVTKSAKRMTDWNTGASYLKGNMDIELAIDLLELAPKIDHAVLFSGDGDFRRLVEVVQRRGVRVTVASTVRTRPPVAADELRRQADAFLELADFEAELGRARRPAYSGRSLSQGAEAEDERDPRRDAVDADLEG